MESVKRNRNQLFTNLAIVVSYAQMSAPVVYQIAGVTEFFATDIASVRLLSSMCEHVFLMAMKREKWLLLGVEIPFHQCPSDRIACLTLNPLFWVIPFPQMPQTNGYKWGEEGRISLFCIIRANE